MTRDSATTRRTGWLPGRDTNAVRHRAAPGALRDPGLDRETPQHRVAVIGGGIAGLAAATALAERGVAVTVLEREARLGGRVRSWPIDPSSGPSTSAGNGEGHRGIGEGRSMSRGFHAFFRQYYNLRALLRRADPMLVALRPVEDYPLVLAGSHTDSFAKIPRTPPYSLAVFVARSPSFALRDLTKINAQAALELLAVEFPQTNSAYDGESAAQFLDRLRFPYRARHLALEVFARSFFADPADFAAGELVAMFHTYFVGSAEGLLFDVPVDDYDTSLWAPLGRLLAGLGVEIQTGRTVTALELTATGARLEIASPEGRASVEADAVVLAADPASTRRLIGECPDLGDEAWRSQVAAGRNAPPFVVWRLWLDRPVSADRPPFLGTSGFGPLDNVSVLELFEAGAAQWRREHGGSVIELHAYAVDPGGWGHDPGTLRRRLRTELARVYPETEIAQVRHDEWLLRDDCPLIGTDPWHLRPGVVTPDRRLVLAGDGVRCEFPVALMERAATTGFQAANTLLSGWGLAGHDLWTVPLRGLLAGR